MGDHQTHPTDHTAEGHAGGRQHRGTEDHHQTQPLGVHTHGAGLLLAQREQVDAPTQGIQRHQTYQHGDNAKRHIAQTGAGQAAHQPIGNFRQLIGGVRHQLHIRGAGGEQRADHNAGEQDVHHLTAPGTLCDQIDQHHGGKAEDECRCGHAAARKAQQNCQRGTEARTGRRA